MKIEIIRFALGPALFKISETVKPRSTRPTRNGQASTHKSPPETATSRRTSPAVVFYVIAVNDANVMRMFDFKHQCFYNCRCLFVCFDLCVFRFLLSCIKFPMSGFAVVPCSCLFVCLFVCRSFFFLFPSTDISVLASCMHARSKIPTTLSHMRCPTAIGRMSIIQINPATPQHHIRLMASLRHEAKHSLSEHP